MFDGNLLLIGYLYTEDLIDHIYDEKTIIYIYITGEFEANLKINATWDSKYAKLNTTRGTVIFSKLKHTHVSPSFDPRKKKC
jgi:hypothetical protein